ncbi:MAG: hypothetical protein H7Y18_17185 [Clostridiaceae bacterium]|nr:hypothetical protein [Clostridiaceae bacterium]
MIKKIIMQGLIFAILITTYGCKVINTKEVGKNQKVNIVQSISTVVEKKDDQVRNNKLKITEKSIITFWDDPVFKDFKDTGKGYKEYEKWLIERATEKGINKTKLLASLRIANTLKGDKVTMFPVIIETTNFNNKESFVIVFTWELTSAIKEEKTVKSLGHIFIVAIEADSKNVIAQEGCM